MTAGAALRLARDSKSVTGDSLRPVTGPRRPKTDPGILGTALALHAVRDPRILDASYGAGRIWGDLPYRPVALDVRSEVRPDVVGDWRELGSIFGPNAFDVVVWDPPHVEDAGSGRVGELEWFDRYGTGRLEWGESVSGLYVPFLRAAREVLVERRGIVIAKIADQVHNSALLPNFVEFVICARELGWRLCDYTIKARSAGMVDPKRIRQQHLPKPWSFWIVLRNGRSCLGPGLSLERVCAGPGCTERFRPRANYSLARYCSDACRQAGYRARGRD